MGLIDDHHEAIAKMRRVAEMKRVVDFIRRIFGTHKVIWCVNSYVNSRVNSCEKRLTYELRRNSLIDHIMRSSEQGISNERYANHEIIVSLTTYGRRIYDVAFTIESIMQQSMKANRIILWLDNSYLNKRLPSYLYKQKDRGLEIRFCRNMRSYKKMIPSLRCFPDDAIITIDDDALYDNDLLECLIVPYLADPQYIYCHRSHRMTFDDGGSILPYNQWQWCSSNEEPSHLNFATGCGGILYPPHCLDNEVYNESVFLDICKYNDDIWFKAMAIKKGTLVKKVNSRSKKGEDYILNEDVQDIGLYNTNKALNDTQIKAVFSKYNIF